MIINVYSGSEWRVQPFDYAPTTEIRSDGQFETETHGGSIYAALVVRASYKARPKLSALPPVSGDVIARTRITGKKE